MGNKLGFVKEEPAAPDEPPKPAPTPAEIFNLKEQFLECWTVDDVVEWLKFHSYEEFSDIVKQLFIDGDALIHLAYFLSSNKASNENENSKEKSEEENAEDNNNNNNNNTEQKKIKVERPTFPLSPQALKIIQQIEAVNNDKVAKLLETIREVVGKYEDQFGSQSTKGDDTFPPYDYPQFEDKENPANRKDIVMFYHHNTQHTQTGGSRSVERRWFSQPRIFRRYFGAPYSKLDIPINLSTSSPSPTLSTPYNNLYFPSPSLSLSSLPPSLSPPSLSPPSLSSLSSPSALNSKSLSEFLFYSLSVSGRRDLWTLTSSPRSAWVKRVNPSSGGLHPIETYLILPPWIANTKEKEIDKEGGVYHYAVRHHALEKRCSISNSEFSKLDSLLNNGENFVIGVSSIHWREVWKYGERGFRYCMLDAGHALGSLAIAAARLGWKITLLPSIATDDVESILGLTESNQFISPVEKERGLILGIVNTSGKSVAPSHLPELQKILKNAKWEGVANHLSADHKEWDIVSKVDHLTKVDYIDQDSIMKVTEMPKEENSVANFSFLVKEDSKKGVTELGNLTESMSLENVIMSRRSALDYISKPISFEQFVHILYTLCQSDNILNIPWPATANIFFFAYHITDLPSGIYVLVLNPSELEKLKETTKDHDFAWTAPAGISSLPFYLLKEIPKEELSKTSYTSSCAQHIASQGAFSVGMFVDVEKVMESMGPSGYCRAHFECGALGQVLYLEAHALGLGATGMGCYLDDLARNTFGLQNSSYWPMYHFAIGVPSVDNRYTPYDYNDNMFEGVLDECVGILQPR